MTGVTLRRRLGQTASRAASNTRPPCTVPRTGTSFSARGRRPSGPRQHAEVGALAALDGADLAVQVQRGGGAQRDRVQRGGDGMRSCSPSTRPAGGQPVDGAPGGEQRAQRRDRRVAVDGQRHAFAQRGGAGVHAFGAFRPDGDFTVLVAPVEVVVGEQVGAHAQRLHAAELRRIGQLHMLQREAVVGRRAGTQRRFHAVQRQGGGLVAVGVRVHLHAGFQGALVAVADRLRRVYHSPLGAPL
jgi:hypothetical protein